jgi:hypothetical protein
MAVTELRTAGPGEALVDRLTRAKGAMEAMRETMRELERHLAGVLETANPDRVALRSAGQLRGLTEKLERQLGTVTGVGRLVGDLVQDSVGYAAFCAWRRGETEAARELVAARDALAEKRGATHG